MLPCPERTAGIHQNFLLAQMLYELGIRRRLDLGAVGIDVK